RDMTKGSCSTFSHSARRLTHFRRRVTTRSAPPISGRKSTAASCSTPGRCSHTNFRTSGSISVGVAPRSCASTPGHASYYVENSRQATFVQQEYAIRNPLGFEGYGKHSWGFTACDGPGWVKRAVHGVDREFQGYIARGAPFGPDDGTLAPWVVVASLPFAPEIVIPTVRQFAPQDLGMR